MSRFATSHPIHRVSDGYLATLGNLHHCRRTPRPLEFNDSGQNPAERGPWDLA
jgi:hypothetical protein